MADMGMYVLASLMGAGYLLNDQKQKRQVEDSKTKTLQKPRVGTDIYNSRDYFVGKRVEEKLLKKNWEDSKNPLETGVIPMYYNTLKTHQDSGKIPNKDYQSKLIYDVIQHLDPEARKTIEQHRGSAIHDIDREMKPDWGIVMDRPVPEKKDSIPLKQIGGSLIPNNEDFTHNNMVPFYKGSITQDIRMDCRSKEGKLELYTGQFKLNKPQKEECGMFFEPTKDLTNIYGAKEQRDITRYNPNNTGKKNNELPFCQTRVGRGLNKGFTAQPSGGFHSMVRIMPKPVEQLRVDPVVETEGRVKSGKSHVDRRAIISQMYKNKPELLVENKKGERNFTTVGAIKGRKLRPSVVLKDTNRKKSRFLINHGKATDKHRVIPKTKGSTKQNFYNTPFRNATSETKKVDDYGKKGYRNRLNNRAVTGTKSHIIAPKGSTDGHKKRPEDKAKKTRKQHYIHHARTYGNTGIQRPDKGPSYNPREWAAKTTIRETTEQDDHLGVAGMIGGGAHPAYNPKEYAARTTVKETTEDTKRTGNVGMIAGHTGPSYKPEEYAARATIKETTEDSKRIGNVGMVAGEVNPSYNPKEYAARTTIRETTENKKHKGWIGTIMGSAPQSYNLNPAKVTVRETTEDNKRIGGHSGIRKKHIAYNPNDYVAKTTIRETTEDNKRVGGHSGILKKHIVYDPDDRARTTIRETTEDNKRIGNAGGRRKHVAKNQDQARTTIRETTEKNDHIAGVSNVQAQSGKGYLSNKYEAKNTNRQFTSDYEYTGVANAGDRKSKSYDDAYNARTNINKEVIAKGRRPKGGGPRLGHQEINIEVKKMDKDRENQYAVVKSGTVCNIYNPDAVSKMTNTSEKNHLPQDDIRFDTQLVDAYKRNPLTQSLNSWA